MNQTARTLILVFAGALFFAIAAPAAPVFAEDSAPAASADAAELESVIADIEDEARREKLLEHLRALLAAQKAASAEDQDAETGGVLEALSARVRDFSAEIVAAGTVIFEAPQLIPWIKRQVGDPVARGRWVEVLWKLLLVLAAGLVAEWIARTLLRRPRTAVEGRDSDSLLLRLPFLALRTVLDLLPLVAFAAAAYGVLPLTEPGLVARLVILAIVNANLLARAVLVVARLVLTPAAASLRVLPIRDVTANYLFIWTRRLSTVAIYGYFAAQAALLLGLPAGGYRAFLNLVGLLVTGIFAVFLIQNRAAIGAGLRGAAPDRAGTVQSLRNRVADVWHVLAVAYVIAVYLVWAIDIPGGFAYLARATVTTVAAFAAAALIARALARIVTRVFVVSDEVKARFPGIEARANLYLPAFLALLRTALYLLAAAVALQSWGLDVFAWIAGPGGGKLLSGAISIIVIVLAALIIWEAASALIERALDRADGGNAPAERRARLKTLLPLARKAILIALVIMVVLVTLSEFGINIAPLLAGAGVAGLAIGFGAQTLVKDVITGLFILVEDTVAVGDVVSVAGHTGIAEALSIRSIRLRSYDGILHTVPFSEVTTVQNFTKEFSRAVFEIGVAYRENVDEVMDVMHEVAAELRQDEDFAADIIEDLDIAGLDQFGDSAVVIRARMKTVPGQQWAVRREYNRRLKAAFDAAGIEMPFPHLSVYFGEDKDGAAPPARIRMEDGKNSKTAKKSSPPRKRPSTASRARRDRAGDLPDDGE